MAVETASQPPSVSDLNACVSPGHRPPVKAQETTFRQWVVANQIGISLTILSMLLAVHQLYPSLRPYTTPFFQLSYYRPDQGDYIQGWDDIYFVASSAIAFTAIRAITIDWILQPLARHAGLKPKAALRLAEQGWQCVYYGFFWCFGMYIWMNAPFWKGFGSIWADWPARGVSGTLKWYLLVQLAFWLQQIFVINVEERRKDHYQMFTHHIITSTLLASAYIYSFYNVSVVVLCLMDIVDLMLPTAKILKYLKFERTCNIAFGVFMVTWLISRHIFYPMLCWSIFKEVPAQMAYGCYSGTTAEMISDNGYPDQFTYLFYPFLNLDGPICMNRTIKWIFLGFLLALQLLSIIWFTMVVRVAVGVLRTGNAEDTRSDDEEDAEDVRDKEGSSPATADTSNADWRRANASSTARPRGRGRGRVRLGEQSDRKALLGRIGCDKPT
ncbi:longevity assurance proteins LAG1/LAC1 [Aspergillus taichungensis]|uniref:Longevity assurance proteins LAG1/LAC1 n=1 Tax=Aspergillus taichungensis TaxID=482145 RepID=A0A2J5HIP4_9EURO|nr:longevity assurance proteins LAG1/LAC1 [Aspergillus taichungensis]